MSDLSEVTNNFINKKVKILANRPNSEKPFTYIGILLEITSEYVILNDRMQGKKIIPFIQILEITKAQNE